MSQIKKNVVVIAFFVFLSVFAFYWYATRILRIDINKNDDTTSATVVAPVESRKVSAVATYMATEDKQDSLQFVVTLDKEGTITDLTTLDAKTGNISEKKKPFNEQVSVMIKGKKLSELVAIDNVAKSTLTTKAFNGVIDQLKAQL